MPTIIKKVLLSEFHNGIKIKFPLWVRKHTDLSHRRRKRYARIVLKKSEISKLSRGISEMRPTADVLSKNEFKRCKHIASIPISLK